MKGIVTGLILVMLISASTSLATTNSLQLSKQQKLDLMEAEQTWVSGQTLSFRQLSLLADAGFKFDEPVDSEIDDFGGPDTFGHLWADSNEPDGPTYEWVDITATGINVAGELGDDATTGPFDLGFDFPFYLNSYSEIYVQSNGGLTFQDYYFYYSNQELPYSHGQPDNSTIFWFWDDWYVNYGTQGDIYVGQAFVDDRLAWVVSYIDVDHISVGSTTSQCILFEDGEMVFQYQEFSDDFMRNSCTIGIQNEDLSDYLQILYNDDYLEEEMAISIFMADPDASLSGTVTSSVSGEPIEDAIVNAGPWTTTTNASGQYLIETLYGGFTYDIEVIGPNYYVWHGSTTVQVGENTLDVEIDPFPEPYDGSYWTDFEYGIGLFELEPGADWEYGTPTFWPIGAYSGDNALSTILTGSYNNSRDDWLVMTETFLVVDEESFLSYWHWFNYEAMSDGYNVQVSVDGMESWQVLDPNVGYNDPDGVVANGNQPCWNNSGPGSGAWIQVTYDLSQYIDLQIWIAFRHTTNESGNVYSGVTIDDLEVSVGSPPNGLEFDPFDQLTSITPNEFGLSEAYPNPFNSNTSMQLSLPEAVEVKVQVFNVMGQEVATLVNGRLYAGNHPLTLKAESLSSGVYFVRAYSPGKLNIMRKITLIR